MGELRCAAVASACRAASVAGLWGYPAENHPSRGSHARSAGSRVVRRSVLGTSAGHSVWTGLFYVLREDGSFCSYPSKDIEGQVPVKVTTTAFLEHTASPPDTEGGALHLRLSVKRAWS